MVLMLKVHITHDFTAMVNGLQDEKLAALDLDTYDWISRCKQCLLPKNIQFTKIVREKSEKKSLGEDEKKRETRAYSSIGTSMNLVMNWVWLKVGKQITNWTSHYHTDS